MNAQAALRVKEVNPAKLAALYRRQFELCKVQRGETIAVVSDLGTRREYVQAAFAAADEHGADVYELCVNSIPSGRKSAQVREVCFATFAFALLSAPRRGRGLETAPRTC